jgi:hypothetical protein
MIRKFISMFICLILLSALTACSGSGAPRSPVGSYAFGSTSFKLDSKGVFWLEHTPSSEDKQHYVLNGTYTYTLDNMDTVNEISFGKIDITITGILIDGVSAKSLDFTSIHTGTDVSTGEKLLGWWKYMNRITYGGKLNIGVNLPFHGYRPEDVYTGRDYILQGDPINNK